MKKALNFIKRNSFPIALIILGLLIFYWVRNYKQVPSGIGPAFFPKVVATLLIGLSIIQIIVSGRKENEGEFTPKSGSSFKILLVCVMFIACVLIMKYVYSLLGIFLFLVGYLCIFASVKFWKSLIISLVGTGVMFLMIHFLSISM